MINCYYITWLLIAGLLFFKNHTDIQGRDPACPYVYKYFT